MFLEVKYTAGFKDDRSLIVVDSEFEEDVTLPTYDELHEGLNIYWIERIISVYERRKKNVAVNVIRVLQWTNINRHEIYKKESAVYARYAPEIERLLLLI